VKTVFKASITILLITISSLNILGQNKDKESIPNEAELNSHRLRPDDVETLLMRPASLGSPGDGNQWRNVHDFPVVSNGIILAAKLYLPEGEGPWPAVILVPGGFNQTKFIMRTPQYEAPHLARCGYATVVYHKRGVGPSRGSYADATYDDFIDDVGHIAKRLATHADIDPSRIGARGGSGGGLILQNVDKTGQRQKAAIYRHPPWRV